MANLEQIMAETSKSYDASRNALNNQINAIAGDLASQKEQINAQYAQQQKNLENQRNYQAQASSMAASNNGGSFGGSAEVANQKWYRQAYVPAVTQLYTNQSNDLKSADVAANQRRDNLNTQLASLEDQAKQYAYQRYDAALAAEEQKRQFDAQLAAQKAAQAQNAALQRQQIAAQNAYTNYLKQANTAAQKYGVDANASRDGQIYYKNNNTGASVRFGTYANSLGGNYKGLLQQAAAYGDNDAQLVLNYISQNPNAKIGYMGGKGVQKYSTTNSGLGQYSYTNTLKQALNRLGITVSGIK